MRDVQFHPVSDAPEHVDFQRLAAGERRIPEMIPTLYAAVDRRLWPAAAHSVLAHMVELVKTGRVTARGEGLEAEYRLAG